MTLPSHPFQGASFFANIRPLMDANRGMFGGSEGSLQYVVMDANLYRLEIFRRPASQRFTDAARGLGSDLRVIVNGQLFGRSRLDYHFTSPGPVQWQGEIIENGTTRQGNPSSRADARLFGRENGVPIWRYHVAQGDPSSYSPPLHHAMGALLPLIQGRIRFGNGTVGTPPNVQQYHSNATTQWINFPADQGKTIAGIHRGSGCLFVICQEDGASSGMNIDTLIRRMMDMGVDDAVLCDGSNSASLIVDGTVHATPAGYKNNSIPTGLMFRLSPLPFGSGGTITIDPSTTDAQFLSNFPVGTVLQGISGTITANSSGGLRLNLTSLGAPAMSMSHPVDPAAEMGITLPLDLVSSSTDLLHGVSFAVCTSCSAMPMVTLTLTLQRPGAGGGDRMTGELEVTNQRGIVSGPVEVPL